MELRNWLLICAFCVVGTQAFLVRRDPIEVSVPVSGDLSNTSTHYDPETWVLYNPVFNQTTWEAQPYVFSPEDLC